MCVTTSNNFGFGTEAPGFKVDVTGTLRATELRNSGGVVTSDRRMKQGITSLPGLDLWEVCLLLNAVSFLYDPNFSETVQEIQTDEEGNKIVNTVITKIPLPQGIQYGYIAQEIEEYFPELISEDPRTGIKYLNQGGLFPIFQSAATAKIVQLEEQLDQQQAQLDAQQAIIQSLSARLEALENAT